MVSGQASIELFVCSNDDPGLRTGPFNNVRWPSK